MTTKTRILVVEDDDLAAATVSRILERAGHEVRREGNTTGALATAKAWQPACVLVDRRLPDGDGLALARRLRRSGQARVVVMSGDPPAQGDRRGVDGYLLKPADVRAVLEAIAGSA
jgi:DNA-binding response OmpR family regulator